MKDFTPDPKPEPKEKKKFGFEYWNERKKINMQKAAAKRHAIIPLKDYDKFCKKIWKERGSHSELSGQKLPEYDPHSPKYLNLIRYHLHHIKPKSKYPELIVEESNIIVLTKYEHEIIEWGSDKQREEIGWTKYLSNLNLNH